MLLSILCHIPKEGDPVDIIVKSISWGIIGGCAFLFSWMWLKSHTRRKYYKHWADSMCLFLVFAFWGIDKILDIVTLLYYPPLAFASLTVELLMATLFMSWLIHNISEKTLPIFLPVKEINSIDISHHESNIYASRIEKMLVSKKQNAVQQYPEAFDENDI